MEKQDLILAREDNIAILTLNRPEKYNPMSRKMLNEAFPLALAQLRHDDGVRVLIITGADPAFCSGADVTDLEKSILGAGPMTLQVANLSRMMHGVTVGLRDLGKPVIAAVNGMCAGGGFSLALACDIRLASEKARFSMAFVRRGLIPDLGATYTLPRLVGASKALEIMLTGDIFDPPEALRLGIVSKVVPHAQLMKEARGLAAKLAKGPAITQDLIRQAVYRGLEGTLSGQLDFESYSQTVCRTTEDFKEGVHSFLEKREPVFKGR